MEQAFVDGATVGERRIKNLTTAFERLAQAFASEHHALRIDQPKMLADALVFEYEEPTVNLRARRGGEQSAAQRQILRHAVLGLPAELNPGIAYAPVVTSPHQQIPSHLLAGIAIWFDARGFETGVQQQRQRQ